jgi:hypothetical protein
MGAEVSPMSTFSKKTMADYFALAAHLWERRALREVVPDFYSWCAANGLFGTGLGQFKPASDQAEAAPDPEFASGASVTFVDGSIAVRDLDELSHGRPADWRALPSLPEDFVQRLQEGLL